VVESALPAAAFTIAYTLSGSDQGLAALVALVIGGLLTVARLVRGQTLQYALSGVAGVGLAAFIVSRTGRAEDFFLPGLLINAAYAAGYAISILVGWPLLGVIIGSVTGRGWPGARTPGRCACTRAPRGCGSASSSCAWRCSSRSTWPARWWRSARPGGDGDPAVRARHLAELAHHPPRARGDGGRRRAARRTA
jgi:hypothetical protein